MKSSIWIGEKFSSLVALKSMRAQSYKKLLVATGAQIYLGLLFQQFICYLGSREVEKKVLHPSHEYYKIIKGYFWTADIFLSMIFFMTLSVTSFKSFNSVSLLSFCRLRVHRNMAIEY